MYLISRTVLYVHYNKMTCLSSRKLSWYLQEAREFVAKCKERDVQCHHIIVDGAAHGFMTYGCAFDDVIGNVLGQVRKWLKSKTPHFHARRNY